MKLKEISAIQFFLGILMLLLISFKLTGYIDWSWGAVFSPIIIYTIQWIIKVTYLVVVGVKAAKKKVEWEKKHPVKKSRWQLKLEEIQNKQQR